MKQNKLVIVVLVIIAVLFIIGLSSGVFRDKEKSGDKLTMSKAQAYKKRWAASLNEKMSSFRTPLDTGRLSDRAICPQPPGSARVINLGPDRSIELDSELECSIKIAESKDDEDLESAILTVGGGNAALKVAYPGIGACSKSRGMKSSFKTIKTPIVTPGLGKIKQPKVKQGLTPPKYELIVAYLPADNEKVNETYCSAVEKINLAVLKKGGTIVMKCTGCDRQKKKTIRVKLE